MYLAAIYTVKGMQCSPYVFLCVYLFIYVCVCVCVCICVCVCVYVYVSVRDADLHVYSDYCFHVAV